MRLTISLSLFVVIGWAASVLHHESVRTEIETFYRRPDTFSLGVCNGCQLMALLGLVGDDMTGEQKRLFSASLFLR